MSRYDDDVPKTKVCKEHERVVFGPERMLVVPPRHYCIIANPVVTTETTAPLSSTTTKSTLKGKEREKDGVADGNASSSSSSSAATATKTAPTAQVVFDDKGQAKLRHGDREIRYEVAEPFPLYPGEQLSGSVTPLEVIKVNTALHLRANRDFLDRVAISSSASSSPSSSSSSSATTPVQRRAGDEWLFEGPATYIPQVQVDVVGTVNAVIVKPNQALKLKAKRSFVDRNGVQRKAGEEWLMRQEGAYLPDIHETILQTVQAMVLTEKQCVHLRALHTFTDVFGKERKAGEEWLVTDKDKETHIPDVYEQVVKTVNLTSLDSRQWCIVHNPVDERGVPQRGTRKLVKGEAHFFLQPGELLDQIGIQSVYVLGEEEALYVTCLEAFEDPVTNKAGRVTQVSRVPGERWFIYGPCEYVPPLEVKVIEKRKAWLQVENLGLYAFFWIKS